MSLLSLLQKKFLPNRPEPTAESVEESAQPLEGVTDVEIPEDDQAVTTGQEPASDYGPGEPLDSNLALQQEARPSHRRRRKEEVDDVPDEPKGLLARLKLPVNHPIRRYWRRYRVGKILLLILASAGLLIGSYLFYLAKTARVSDLQTALKAVTVIYDRNGQEAGSLSGQKGTYVELDAISDDLEQAVLATEDRTFYDNRGINFKRTLLAVLTMGRSGGGSTITQQLAKNAYLTQDQTIKRKAREFFLALELTKQYSKDDILTMYLNHAYFGNGVWGVEDASQKYFGVPAAQLSLDEAATLAGMLKGPELYNPYYSLEHATNRRNTVLQAMVDAGYISQEVADQHMGVAMESRLSDTYVGRADDYAYPSYFDAVINEAISRYGLNEKDIVNNGYRIYTELDQNYQAGMQATFDNDALFPVSSYDNTQAQGASVALDPATGGVRGLVGRVNSSEQSFRSFNYATQAQRSPASSIKPLVVYTPALASGWETDRLLPNSTLDFHGYIPNNYGGYQSEDVPLYQALANSYNIPAVYALDQLGIDKAVAYGNKFGLEMKTAKQELGLALGGGVTTNPLEMAQAYAVFANGGVMNQAHLITRIEKADGQVIKEYKPSPRRVISQSVADKMTSMLLGTFSNGTGVNANVYGYTLAGKTGTSEADIGIDLAASDQWVIGYTPDVVISQWVGFDQTDEHHYLSDSSAGTASQIFSTQASYILPYTAGTPFRVENSYAVNGIAPDYTDLSLQESSQDIIEGLRQSAQEAADKLSQAAEQLGQVVDEAGLVEDAQNFFQDILNYLK